MKRLFLTLTLVLLPVVVFADFYSWTDKAGNQFFADDLSKVPPEYRDQARKMGSPASAPTNTAQRQPRVETHQQTFDSVTLDQNGHDEQWWRGQVRKQREQISKEEDNVAYYNDRQRQCEEDQRNGINTWRNCSLMYQEGRKRAEWNIEKARRRIEVELPEEARKAGALPGWVRE